MANIKGAPPKAVDMYVGKMIRAERMLRHLSQTDLANHLGIAFQQVQKYEKGTNRVSCSKLYEIAEFFNVEPNVFFPPRKDNGQTETAKLIAVANAPKLLRAFAKLDPKIQKAAADSMTAFADQLDRP